MEQEILKTEVQELNLQQVRQNLLPLNTLQKGDNYIFLYSIGGDGKKLVRQQILKSIKLNIPEPGEITKDRLPEGTQISVGYFFDADNKGVVKRLSEVNTEIRSVISTITASDLSKNGSFSTFEGLKIGSYIFTGDDNETGKLEDILVPLMQTGNERIFKNTELYLSDNYDPERIFPLKLSVDQSGKILEKRSTKNADTDFDKKKSLIGIAGQLQRSGKPNTAYISDTDFLSLSKITSNAKCQEIALFFDKFIAG